MLSDVPLYATIPVKDLKESMDFYGKTLGMDLIEHSHMEAWYRTGTTQFAIYQSGIAGSSKKVPAAIWLVDKPELLIKTLEKRGVVFETENFLGYDLKSRGKMFTTKGYRVAWFKDPSGNIISIAARR